MILEGLFLFTSMIYQGNPMPMPNPNLVMTFEFSSDGINRLKYFRKNETGFCERLAAFEFNEGTLKQQVTWLNPANADYCSSDPDMIFGKESTNKAFVVGNSFQLVMPMGEEELTMVWDKQ